MAYSAFALLKTAQDRIKYKPSRSISPYLTYGSCYEFRLDIFRMLQSEGANTKDLGGNSTVLFCKGIWSELRSERQVFAGVNRWSRCWSSRWGLVGDRDHQLAFLVVEMEFVEMAPQLSFLVLGVDDFGWTSEILEVIHEPAQLVSDHGLPSPIGSLTSVGSSSSAQSNWVKLEGPVCFLEKELSRREQVDSFVSGAVRTHHLDWNRVEYEFFTISASVLTRNTAYMSQKAARAVLIGDNTGFEPYPCPEPRKHGI
ncbi:hypothetical protein KCU81_g305, partial [Aureobasidium melanogenum]